MRKSAHRDLCKILVTRNEVFEHNSTSIAKEQQNTSKAKERFRTISYFLLFPTIFSYDTNIHLSSLFEKVLHYYPIKTERARFVDNCHASKQAPCCPDRTLSSFKSTNCVVFPIFSSQLSLW